MFCKASPNSIQSKDIKGRKKNMGKQVKLFCSIYKWSYDSASLTLPYAWGNGCSWLAPGHGWLWYHWETLEEFDLLYESMSDEDKKKEGKPTEEETAWTGTYNLICDVGELSQCSH